ncbi:MAG: PilZ domain-containing protein [Terriglobales bacterium]
MSDQETAVEEIREFEYRVPRFQVDFHFVLQTELGPGVTGQGVINARCHEISEGGLAAWVAEPLDVNSKVILLLSFPCESAPVPVAAVVTRRHGSDHAFSFVLPSMKERDHLRQHLLPMQSSEG